MVCLRSPDGAFSEIVKKSYGFLAVPPGGPQRTFGEVLSFFRRSPEGAFSAHARKSDVFLRSPQGALSEKIRKSCDFFLGIPTGPSAKA